MTSFDNAAGRWGVGWNITMGLYWIRPWTLRLWRPVAELHRERLGIEMRRHGPKNRCSAQDYMKVLDTLSSRFQEDAFPVHSFPELSLAAWNLRDAVRRRSQALRPHRRRDQSG